MPASPRLRLDTVAGRWLDRFEAKVAAGERHARTLEAHRYQFERNLLPRLCSRQITALGVQDVAALISELRAEGRSARTTANAIATLLSALRAAGLIRVRAQLSRAHRGEPARRVAPKTPASVREVPLVEQLAARKQASPFAAPTDWAFATSRGTSQGQRNVAQRAQTGG